MVQPFVNAVTKFDKAVGELIENLKSETVIKTVSTSINNSNNEQNSYKNYKNRNKKKKNQYIRLLLDDLILVFPIISFLIVYYLFFIINWPPS